MSASSSPEAIGGHTPKAHGPLLARQRAAERNGHQGPQLTAGSAPEGTPPSSLWSGRCRVSTPQALWGQE